MLGGDSPDRIVRRLKEAGYDDEGIIDHLRTLRQEAALHDNYIAMRAYDAEIRKLGG